MSEQSRSPLRDQGAAAGEPIPPVRVVADRVRQVRGRRGMSAQKLADRCAELGAPKVNRAVISNLENGRRESVTVDELFALALALDTSPVFLMLPLDQDTEVAVTATRAGTAGELREWLRGHALLDGQDERAFWSEIAEEDWRSRERLRLARGLVAQLTEERSPEELVRTMTPEQMVDALIALGAGRLRARMPEERE